MLKHNQNQDSADAEHWISLSDLMTALMMLFLLISVVYMIKVQDSVDIPRIFKADQQQMHAQMHEQFKDKLNKWGAVLNPDLTVRFNHQDIQFATGSQQLRPEFQRALDEFFPQYLHILMQEEYRDKIKEIRIEGHTSSLWVEGMSEDEAYIKNMNLSQGRAQETLIYLLTHPSLNLEERQWLKQKFRAIGFSSSQLLNSKGLDLQVNEQEDTKQSQRVEFRVVTNTEDKIREMVGDK
ncbi:MULTISPECIES: OmpA family protein [Vitreoscilla]|uniref:OmpA family protein n=1 Tax=Vitreoscilla stercoraria TaxID=61 RepID=A0ABY4EAQ3_VITST|nr:MULTISPECIES: OmpA family protein [Vitreoscilla]UOO92537.1 OmpA family protein [Vitreoscilla stercoraria]